MKVRWKQGLTLNEWMYACVRISQSIESAILHRSSPNLSQNTITLKDKTRSLALKIGNQLPVSCARVVGSKISCLSIGRMINLQNHVTSESFKLQAPNFLPTYRSLIKCQNIKKRNPRWRRCHFERYKNLNNNRIFRPIFTKCCMKTSCQMVVWSKVIFSEIKNTLKRNRTPIARKTRSRGFCA